MNLPVTWCIKKYISDYKKKNNLETPVLPHLYWLSDEHTLEEGHHHGDQPADGALLPKFQTIKHSEIRGHDTCGSYQEPADKNKPPGQTSVTASFLRPLLVVAASWRSRPVSDGSKNDFTAWSEERFHDEVVCFSTSLDQVLQSWLHEADPEESS